MDLADLQKNGAASVETAPWLDVWLGEGRIILPLPSLRPR